MRLFDWSLLHPKKPKKRKIELHCVVKKNRSPGQLANMQPAWLPYNPFLFLLLLLLVAEQTTQVSLFFFSQFVLKHSVSSLAFIPL
jgi:hypothetical protein